MEEVQGCHSHRERILIDLKSIIKQVYHEAVNHELSPDNVNYITQNLLKRLDESLMFGLKQPQNGYWKIVQKILHPDSLSQLVSVRGFGHSNLIKGKAWIGLSLLDDAFVSYMNCFVLENNLEKFYEDWSILRHNDSCNSFLSLLSGIENVSFKYEMSDTQSLPTNCQLFARLISGASAVPLSPTPSLTDSGVQLDRSEDYLNGNLPSAGVVLRRKPRDAQRHVSFHEDSLGKSPSQRKLRWDVENSRYSWAGEELDALKLPGLGGARSSVERGAPEGEEASGGGVNAVSVAIVGRSLPTSKFAVNSRPFAATKRARRLSARKIRVDWEDLRRFTQELDSEVRSYRRPKSINEVELPDKLSAMLGLRGAKSWTYKLWGKVLVLTPDTLILLHRDLHTTILKLSQVEQVVVFPHAHEIHLLTRKKTHVLRSGDQSLSQEVLTRLAFHLHRAGLPPVDFRILHPDDMTHVKQELISRRVLTEDAPILYLGLVRLQSSDERQPITEPLDKQGCLMYQIGRNQNWQPANLVLRGGVLYLYGEARPPLAAINLLSTCGGCERSAFPDRPHTFSLTLNRSPTFDSTDNCFYQDLALKAELSSSSNKPSSRRGESPLQRWTNRKSASEGLGQWLSGMLRPGQAPTAIHFAAADEYELSDWLQALLTVFCQGSEEAQWETEASEASLLITDDTAVLFTQPAQSQCGFRLLASALIHDISSFSVGCHPQDSYCIIELECMEAGSATSDWVLHFGSRLELEQSRANLERQWRRPEPFPLCSVEDARCERTQDCLAREWFA